MLSRFISRGNYETQNEVSMNLELKNFLAEQIGCYEEEVVEDAWLEKGFGVCGDDAVDLIIAFGMLKTQIHNCPPKSHPHQTHA